MSTFLSRFNHKLLPFSNPSLNYFALLLCLRSAYVCSDFFAYLSDIFQFLAELFCLLVMFGPHFSYLQLMCPLVALDSLLHLLHLLLSLRPQVLYSCCRVQGVFQLRLQRLQFLKDYYTEDLTRLLMHYWIHQSSWGKRLPIFPNKWNKFNNTGARMQDSIYHLTLKLHFVSNFPGNLHV